jgi:anti-sigma B factor antagonist
MAAEEEEEEEGRRASSDRDRDTGELSLASTFLASFPPSEGSTQERQLASLPRVREEGVLTTKVGEEGNELVVRASGELDVASAKTFEDQVRRAIDSEASTVVLDLEGLTFIDSTGLRTLLMAAELSRSKARRLRVRASKEVRRAVEVSGVEDSLQLGD